jgi:DNA-binding transcriptional regulator YiaG
MTTTFRALICASLFALPAFGGEPKTPILNPTPSPVTPGWEYFVTLPGWAAGLSGDVGVGGFAPVSVELGFEEILDHLDMIGALTVEARHGRWGITVDGLYLKMSTGGETPGRLLSSVDVQVEQVLAELAISYRLLEGDRGYLDFIAGARYMYLRSELNFHLDSAGVRDVSRDLSDAAVNRAVGVIQNKVSQAAARARAQLAALNLDERAEALRGELRTSAIERILEQTTIREIIEAIRRLTPAEREQIRQNVENSREVLAASKALTKAVIEERAAAAVSAARRQAQRAIARAKKQLAGAIESAIRRAVPNEVAGSQSWVDPFVGFRGRYDLTDNLYVAARGDIGGFGVASDLTWNAFAALGYQWSRSFSTELGYRHLAVDYSDGGFIYDAEMSGIYLGLTLKL